MTCITYEILPDCAAIRRIFSVSDAGEAPALFVEFEKKTAGMLSLGGKTFRLQNGSVKIPFDALADGEYLPILHTDEKVTPCEGFSLSGKEAEGLGPGPDILRKLQYRLADLEKRVDTLAAECEKFDRRINGTVLF